MWTIFFRRSGFVEGIALEDRKAVTADWYTKICLPKVFSAIEKQREKSGVRGILLHHDNASSHTALRTHLAPCDFWLSPKLKDQLRGRRFFSNEELTGALFLAIEEIPKGEWEMCFDTWLNA
ncbi:Mariner transposase [Oopsacas minuta]|uniref:Mariner transposase n=1 Tax=Oopsacas minuta TaxID=111878 RepID=A0AAV7JK44_9METZ|nr:Mariner transposase [Oopsacas minuta]